MILFTLSLFIFYSKEKKELKIENNALLTVLLPVLFSPVITVMPFISILTCLSFNNKSIFFLPTLVQ